MSYSVFKKGKPCGHYHRTAMSAVRCRKGVGEIKRTDNILTENDKFLIGKAEEELALGRKLNFTKDQVWK